MLDKSIITKCIKGDRKAQETLYNFYSSKMKGVCLRYARSSFEAEDLFQDAFVKIFKNLQNYKGEGSFDGWIRRIVVNTSIDYYKKRMTQGDTVNYDDINESDIDSKIELVNDIDYETLLKLLNELPNGYRMVLNLYAIEGYTHKEIAEILEVSESTSKSQLIKARRYFKALLQKNRINENGTRAF
jgi:RNA polymerase sigma factor (sigma-70 family)